MSSIAVPGPVPPTPSGALIIDAFQPLGIVMVIQIVRAVKTNPKMLARLKTEPALVIFLWLRHGSAKKCKERSKHLEHHVEPGVASVSRAKPTFVAAVKCDRASHSTAL